MPRADGYQSFLRSAIWQRCRLLVIERANGLCERCGGRGWQVHHRTYANVGNQLEHLGDLELLCGDCHAFQHGKSPMPGKMPPCFVCRSQTACEHREMDLLPPTPRKEATRGIDRKLRRNAQTGIPLPVPRKPLSQAEFATLYGPNIRNQWKKRPA